MNIGIILAAGKGTRMNLKDANKTSILLRGKPLAQYGVDLFETLVDKTIVVVGHKAKSVQSSLVGNNLQFVLQARRLGTGHAVLKAVEVIPASSGIALVGNGDHLMCYTPKIVKDFIAFHKLHENALTIMTTSHEDVEQMDNGRIIRSSNNQVQLILEKKDLTPEYEHITELNSGFYCFDLEFLRKNIKKIPKHEPKNEYYLTDLVKIANSQRERVGAFQVPFKFVGTGVNTKDQLEKVSIQSHTDQRYLSLSI